MTGRKVGTREEALAMSGARRGDAGLASGPVTTTVQIAALTDGYQLAFWIGTALVVVAIAVAVTVVKPERRAVEDLEEKHDASMKSTHRKLKVLLEDNDWLSGLYRATEHTIRGAVR